MTPLTAGRLRRELAGAPDDTPITVAYRSNLDGDPLMLVAVEAEDLSGGPQAQVLLQAEFDDGSIWRREDTGGSK